MNNHRLQPENIHVELPALEQLEAHGWKNIIKLEMWSQTPEQSFRTSFDEVFIQSKFVNALKHINKLADGRCYLTEAQIDDFVRGLTNHQGKSLLQINEIITKQFLQQYPTIDCELTGEKGKPVKFIDFENIDNNDFTAITQFRVNVPGGTCIFPDITLFVNGLPLVVIECKHAKSIDSDPVLTGIEDLRMYQEIGTDYNKSIKRGNQKLFWFNQLLVSCSQDGAQYGTIGAAEEHYLDWKTIHPLNVKDSYKKGSQQNGREQLFQGLLSPNNLLDVIYHYALFMDVETASGGKVRVKVAPRYQQFRAVSKAIERLKQQKTKEKRGGVVWHTQGSGKSLTMVYLVKKLRSDDILKRLKVVMVTDRIDLNDQLNATAWLTGETVDEVKKVSELTEKLGNTTNNVVMAMIQKFQNKDDVEESEEDENEGESETDTSFPEINNSPDLLVLVDEAHRTHNSSLGVRLNCAFPAATKIAFTGTPLITERHKKKTIETFGDYIDTYKFNEAIRDGATLSILYEGKTVKKQGLNSEGFESEFEDMFSDKTPEEIERIKKKYGTTGDILESEKRIKLIATDLVQHYVENILPNGFKAQVVTSSRIAAHRYVSAINEAVQEYLTKNANNASLSPLTIERLKIAKAALVVSGKGQEKKDRAKELSQLEKQRIEKENELIEKSRTESKKINAVDNFKAAFNPEKPETGICFLVVKDMLLTGFDAPIEQVMYVDKKMVEHNLLQAIARVNRKSKGKTRGYVVDYYGIVNNLNAALAIYANEDKKDVTSAFVSRHEEIPVLEQRYQAVVQVFSDKKIKLMPEYVNAKLKDAAQIRQVHNDCIDLLKEPEIRGRFEVRYRQFLESLDILMPDRACAPYLKPMNIFGQILVDSKRIYERKGQSAINGAGEKVRYLINKYFEAEGVGTTIAPVEITDTEKFQKEVAGAGRPQTQAAAMQHAITVHILKNISQDPARYETLSKKLNEIIERLKDNWAQQILEFQKLIKEINEGRTDVVLDPVKDRFLDLFKKRIQDKLGKYDESKSDEYIALVDRIVETLKNEITRIHDFWGPAHIGARNKLEAEIQDLFLEHEEIYAIKDFMAQEFMKLAKEVLK